MPVFEDTVHVQGAFKAQPGDNEVTEIIQAAAGQTLPFTNWEDSAGDVLLSILVSGAIQATPAVATNNVLTSLLVGDTNPRFSIDGNGKMSWGPGSAAADVYLYRMGVGGVAFHDVVHGIDLLQITNYGGGAGIILPTVGGNIGFGPGGTANIGRNASTGNMQVGGNGAAGWEIDVNSAAQVGLLIKAAASQSADLLQIKNSAGTLLTSIDNNGQPTVWSAGTARGFVVDGGSFSRNLYMGYNIFGAGSTGVGLQANGGGSCLYFVNDGGSIVLRTNFSQQLAIGSSGIQMFSTSATNVPLTVQAAASQSADLLQIKDSASSLLAGVDSGGRVLGQQLIVGQSWVTYFAALTESPTAGLQVNLPYHMVFFSDAAYTSKAVAINTTHQRMWLGYTEQFGADFGGGAGPMIQLAKATTAPSTNPTGGGILYVDPTTGALHYKGASGADTLIAAG